MSLGRRCSPLIPEQAHHLAIRALRIAPRVPFGLRALNAFQPPPKPTTVFGVNFPNPVGLAAGFDKNGVVLPGLAAVGFGFVEIGTVTAMAQPGNPKPRIFRYPKQEALINRLGFNNDGAETVAVRLGKLQASGRWPRVPVGINIGKSKMTPIEEAPEDYLHSFRLLHGFADYITLNVSSPNTPGLRELQEHDALAELLQIVQKENQITGKPILVKIAPDLSMSDLEGIIGTCEENGVAGIIATNTTLDHSAILKFGRSIWRFERTSVEREIDRVCSRDQDAFAAACDCVRWNFRRSRCSGKNRSRCGPDSGLHGLHLSRSRNVARDCGGVVVPFTYSLSERRSL